MTVNGTAPSALVLRDDGVYAVDSYALTAALLRDPRIRPGTTGIVDRLTPEWRRHRSLRMLADMVLLDLPPRHPAVRAVLREQFTPTAVEAMRERIDDITASLLDSIAAETEPIEFTSRIGQVLPLAVIGSVIGIDPADQPRLARRAKAVMDTMWHTVTGLARADGSAVILDRYFHGLLDRPPHEHPEGSLVRALAAVPELDRDAIVANLVFLVIAATFTTGDFLGTAMVRSLRDERFRRHLTEATEVEAAVEEALRLDPPVSRVLRNTAEPVEIAGTRLPEGALIEFDLRAANRDPSKFDDPLEFRPGRSSGRALSFGYGAHYCAGWYLGRTEAEVFLTAFWRRFPTARLVGDPVRSVHAFLHGYDSVRIEPRPRDAP